MRDANFRPPSLILLGAFIVGFFIAGFFITGPAMAMADVPQAGKTYQGPKTFSSPSEGLAFTLPKGWTGGLQGPYFGIVNPKDKGQNGVVLLWSTKGSLAEARQAMAAGIPVSDITLKPKSRIVTKKNELTATYSVIGGSSLTQATITTRAAHGSIVAIISIYSPTGKKSISLLTKALSRSLRITKPRRRPTTTTAATAATAAADSEDTWQKYLTGARLTHFVNLSGYSEKESYTFCPDGTFYRSFSSSSSSVNGTGAAQASNRGTWSATGTGNRGGIILRFANSTVDRSPIVYRDHKTFWGGTRYFYEAKQCGY